MWKVLKNGRKTGQTMHLIVYSEQIEKEITGPADMEFDHMQVLIMKTSFLFT
jgi:hypothetical protein